MAEMFLETDRLLLRLPTITDAETISLLAGDFDVASTTLNIPHPYSVEMAQDWLASVLDRPADSAQKTYILELKETQQLIGAMGYSHEAQHQKAEIGYWIGKPYWGNGYATEGAQALVDYLFEHMNLNRVQASYYVMNPASRRVMEKIGMRHEGVLRQAIIREIASINYKECHDLGYCAILREEWLANKG